MGRGQGSGRSNRGAASPAAAGAKSGGGANETAARGLSAEQEALRSSLSSQINAMPEAQKAQTVSTLKKRVSDEVSRLERNLENEKINLKGIYPSARDEAKINIPAIETKLRELRNNLQVLDTL